MTEINVPESVQNAELIYYAKHDRTYRLSIDRAYGDRMIDYKLTIKEERGAELCH